MWTAAKWDGALGEDCDVSNLIGLSLVLALWEKDGAALRFDTLPDSLKKVMQQI
jgi:hypothetical protein